MADKYDQKRKEKLRKKSEEDIEIQLKNKKKNTFSIIVNIIKILLKSKKRS